MILWDFPCLNAHLAFTIFAYRKKKILVKAISGHCENFVKLRWQLYWLRSPHYRRVSGSGDGYIATRCGPRAQCHPAGPWAYTRVQTIYLLHKAQHRTQLVDKVRSQETCGDLDLPCGDPGASMWRLQAVCLLASLLSCQGKRRSPCPGPRLTATNHCRCARPGTGGPRHAARQCGHLSQRSRGHQGQKGRQFWQGHRLWAVTETY